MEFEIITLFPEFFGSFLQTSLLGKAIAGGLVKVHFSNPRDFAPGKHRSVDDTPYGGGPGMILRPGPVIDAMEAAIAARGPAWRILLSPQGRLFDQAAAARLAAPAPDGGFRRVLLVCGRYEGIDERVVDLAIDEVLSIGDYVLSGGEIAAAVILEAATRLLPGVVGKAESLVDESHAAGRLEYPQYTRPEIFRERPVPAALLSGDHGRVARFRRQQSLLRTASRRPDLIDRFPLSAEEEALLRAAVPVDPNGEKAT